MPIAAGVRAALGARTSAQPIPMAVASPAPSSTPKTTLMGNF